MDNEFRVGQWLIQASRHRIEGHGRVSTVQAKAMAVLIELAKADGEVVSKRLLMDSVWGRAAVTEDALTQCIVQLRKAFGDSASKPAVIETIRGSGFRLLVPVESASRPAPGIRHSRGPLWLAAAATAAASIVFATLFLDLSADPSSTPDHSAFVEPSVGVFPFMNLSDAPEDAYLAAGLAEYVVDALDSVSLLRVPVSASPLAATETDARTIGQRLGVTHVLEGAVGRTQGKLRVEVRLVDLSTGTHQWSGIFERDSLDLFVVQEEIVRSIAAALLLDVELAVTPAWRGTLEIDAYELYLLGRHHLAQERPLRAREFFQNAIDADPGYALAYAGLADTYLVFRETPSSFWQADSGPMNLELAQSAVERALEIDMGLPEAYASLAALRAARGDLAAEEVALRQSIELRPRFASAQIRLAANLGFQQRYLEATEAYRRAAELDPFNPDLIAAMARQTAFAGSYDRAISGPLNLLESGLEFPQVYQALMEVARDYGRLDERVKWGLELVRVSPDRASALAELGDAYTELGEFELAGQWIEAANRISPLGAYKALARWLFATGQTDEFERLAAETYWRDPPREGAVLNPAQAAPIGIYAISRIEAGDYRGVINAAPQGPGSSPTLKRRPPHMMMFALAIVAAGYEALEDSAQVNAIADDMLRIGAEARDGGVRDYAPLLRELAKAHALLGDAETALSLHNAAVAAGWRNLYLEVGAAGDPVDRLLRLDDRYRSTLAEIESDLARMRHVVSNEGWHKAPGD